MYIRNLRKPSPNKNVFKFASTKVGDVIMCESTLEFNACFHNEYNDLIESYGSQPEGFKYGFMGKSLPYTPDTVVVYKDKRVKYHEYKYETETAEPLFRERFSAKRAACLKMGAQLILVTENQITKGLALNNFKLLHRYSGVYGIKNIQSEMLNFINKSRAINLVGVKSQFNLSIGEEARSFLYALLHKGLLKADLEDDDLSNNPTLWVTP